MDRQQRAGRPARHGVRRRIAVTAVAAATAVAGIVLVFAPPVQGATAPHRAAVVVEVDGVIHTAKITFATDSISGLDALRAAGFAPTVRVFGANGGAVCALDVGGTTIGCPADGSCLKCADDSSYWAYWRALGGETRYTYSIAGAGLTQVRDGGVEAWNWSTGAAPSPFVSFADVWGTDPPPTTQPPATHAPTTRPAVPSTAPSAPQGSVEPVSSVPSTTATMRGGASTTSPSTTAAAAGASTTAPVATGVRTADSAGGSRKLATAPVVAKHRGGSPWGLAGFALILVLLVAAIVLARRRRTTSQPA